MPKLSEVLDAARRHVAGGWHEPLSLDAGGRICTATDEGLSRYCVADAIATAAAGDVTAQVDAELAITRQLQLTGEQRSLATWLEDEHRLHGDVLRLFSKAVAHARAGESR